MIASGATAVQDSVPVLIACTRVVYNVS